MTSFGKYQVVEQIGQGGFGRVYRGWDPVLKREVAIKVISLSAPQARERFVREAEIAANLRHPHIVTVFDYGEQDGQPYLVQEFLPGWDLEELIHTGVAGDLRTRVNFLIQAADALRYAHSRGVVHRDVKPGNLRVQADGTLRVMDFGIAKLLDAGADLTATGMSIGTSGYLAPEQLEGLPIDHRADIFSFGVVAYELITGAKPFAGETITTVLYRILHEEPAAIATLAPGTPTRLIACVERCLRKRREDRYNDLGEVVAELRSLTVELDASAGGLSPSPLTSATTAPLSPAASSVPSVHSATQGAAPPQALPTSPSTPGSATKAFGTVSPAPLNLPASIPASVPSKIPANLPAAPVLPVGEGVRSRVSLGGALMVTTVVVIVASSLAFYFRARSKDGASASMAVATTTAVDSVPDSVRDSVPGSASAGVAGVETEDTLAPGDTLAPRAASVASLDSFAQGATPTGAAPRVSSQPATAATTQSSAAAERATARTGASTDRVAAERAPGDRVSTERQTSEDAEPSGVAIDPNRVVILLRGASPAAVELAEHTFVSDLTARGRQVVGRDDLANSRASGAARRVAAGADARTIAAIGRGAGAGAVFVGTLTVDATEAIAGIITGSAVLDGRLYDGTTGAMLAAERFQVGAGGTPGRAGSSALDAISQAAESVTRQAVRVILQRTGSNR